MIPSIQRFARRVFGAAVAGLCLAVASGAVAQPFPSKAVTIVVPYQAGGSLDAIARAIANQLSKTWGQPVVVENRPGANGMIATQSVIKAPADGHTILYHITGIIQNPLLYKSVSYDPLVDVAPVIQIGGQAMGLAVPGKSPIASLDQLVQDGRAKGTKGHTYGSVGVGHTGHIWSELLVSEKKIQATHVAYKGTPALVIDLVSDRIDWAFLSSAEAVVRASDNSVKILAVTGAERVRQMPTVPTMRELGYPGFEMVGWHGLFVPAPTPKAVVSKIETDVRAALAAPELQKVLETQVIQGTGLGAEAFGKLMRDDQARWAALIKRFNIQAE
ncbi:MAG: tripartite tricarboxylate transporter substrate binding protein [Xanthomonadales bacterium]|uniref:Bug family tripartite tricarboxylate transporter substrate binding protein n=1 Tax=Hydrogenophaga sp. TaxID=1904254 RepID=UPI002A36DEB4|nr:tripartite tricarboxylate transporter substrate binding protein [Hydrogenophaga sp.]MCK9490400.1 tripartite tricarboxylate transporter substrate binding protein [Xanthomonadales bacterium]MDX9968786.1 tripartite tricarboxylate transporter substrate binding protein [Hydrogenophaga sp.]